MDKLIKYGLMAGAAYYLYVNFFSGAAAVARSTGLTPAPPVPTGPPAPVVSSPGTWTVAAAASALDKATQNNAFKVGGKMGADQWKFFYNNLAGAPNVDPVYDSIFFPNGRPADPSLYTQMTATEFMQALKSGGVGLSGLGRTFPAHITLPAAAAILRARGPRNYVPFNTPMPRGIR